MRNAGKNEVKSTFFPLGLNQHLIIYLPQALLIWHLQHMSFKAILIL